SRTAGARGGRDRFAAADRGDHRSDRRAGRARRSTQARGHLARCRARPDRGLRRRATWARFLRFPHRDPRRQEVIDQASSRPRALFAGLAALAVALLLWPRPALAAGSNMPWEQPLTQILDSI